MRPLSAYEASIVSRTEHGIYYNFCVAATYSTTLTKDTILHVLAILCRRFPHFSLLVDTTTDPSSLPSCTYRPSWDVSKQKGLVDVFHAGDDATVESVLTHYNNTRVFHYTNLDTPLWKVALLESENTLFFVTDHTYFDGTAAKNFHELFAEALDHLDEHDKSFLVDTTKFPPYPDPTVLMNFRSTHDLPSPVAAIVPPTCLPSFDEKLMLLQLPYHNSTLLQLSAADSKALLQKARANNTKLTALLYAIATKAVVPLVADSQPGSMLKTMIPINTRPRVTSIPQDSDLLQFGLFFGKYFSVDDPVSITNGTLESISQDFQDRLLASIPHAMDDFEAFEVKARKDNKLVDESMEAMYQRNGSPKTTLVMSNLGVVRSSSGQIKRVYFDQPMVDACFGLHFVSSQHDGLCINFTSHRAVPRDVYLQYVHNVRNYIGSLLAASSGSPAC